MQDVSKSGSVEEFRKNWESREETQYSHWTRGKPRNQIQFAFRQHWLLFQELMALNWSGESLAGKRVLEVGCGRGTLSMYFADAGFACTLADVVPDIVEVARTAFAAHGLQARFEIADTSALPFEAASFDIVCSIGLLEHFEDVEPPLREQVRVLAPGGLLLVYVVPENPNNVQQDYAWINALLRECSSQESPPTSKEPVFRTSYLADHYIQALDRIGLRDCRGSGVYPVPMISPSPDFPFTLNNPKVERILVDRFEQMLAKARSETGKNGWLCDDAYGQAFLVWGRK